MTDLTDPAAEASVLAAGLAQRNLIGVMASLEDAVFTIPVHQIIHKALVDCYRANDPRDHSTVLRRALNEASSASKSRAVGQAMADMTGKGGDYAVGFYVDRIKRLHAARLVVQAGQRLIQAAEESAQNDDSDLLDFVVDHVRDDLSLADQSATVSDRDLPMSLDALLSKRFDHDWLIPQLLERMDRMILTGFEGTGKSWLVAQMAMCVAAGLHPFLGTPVSAHHRVLVVDAENSERQTARRYRTIRDRISTICQLHGAEVPDWDRDVRFVIRPEGIALNDHRQLQRIERAIAATEPAFVAMGPLYRLHRLDTRDEQAAKELTDAIDRLRVKYKFAVLCEAHVAHGQQGAQRALRPTGSSLFLRWPEFGMGLRPSVGTEGQQHPTRVDLAAWRGGREDRMWPKALQHGWAEKHLPWNNADVDFVVRTA